MSVYYEMGKQLLREGNISEASRLFEEDINSGGVNGYYGKLLVFDTQLDEFAFNEQLKIVFSEHKDKFIKSASEGDCDSAFICGLYYSLNKRTSQKSHLFFLLAAALGNEVAQYNIAIDYIIGEKVKKNINTAIFWLQKALIKKYLPAADLLGDLMINSLFCPEDCDALFELLRQSSEKGSKNATYILYKCYKEGCFIIPDNEMALKYKKLLSDDN